MAHLPPISSPFDLPPIELDWDDDVVSTSTVTSLASSTFSTPVSEEEEYLSSEDEDVGILPMNELPAMAHTFTSSFDFRSIAESECMSFYTSKARAHPPEIFEEPREDPKEPAEVSEEHGDGECTHPIIDFSTCACKLCGLVLGADYASSIAQVNDFEESRYVRGKPVRKTTLYPEGLDLPFDKEVINRASMISESLNIKGNRINKLRMRRFACLYLALRELNRKYNLHDVADAVGLKRKDMSPAITLFASIHSGYKPPREAIMNLSEHSSITMAIGKAEDLKIDMESQRLIRSLILKALEFHGPAITRRRSETIASGALSVFREITGIELGPDVNLYITKISESTLRQVHDEIMEAYNCG